MADILDYCADLKTTSFKAGAVVLAEGERLGRIDVLREGQIEVIRERMQVTHIDEPGSVFGAMSALLDVDPAETARSRTP